MAEGHCTSLPHLTSDLNGAGREVDLELSHAPDEWNRAYYRLVARSLSGLDPAAIDALCLEPVLCLPDEPLLTWPRLLAAARRCLFPDDKGVAAADLLRISDEIYGTAEDDIAMAALCGQPRLRNTLSSGRCPRCDLPLPGAGFRTPPECYVTAIGMVRAVPFIPLLTELAIATPSLFVALAVLSTVNVSPEFQAYAVRAIEACMAAHPNDVKLWVDYGAGDKFCGWIAGVLRRDGIASIEGRRSRRNRENRLRSDPSRRICRDGDLNASCTGMPSRDGRCAVTKTRVDIARGTEPTASTPMMRTSSARE